MAENENEKDRKTEDVVEAEGGDDGIGLGGMFGDDGEQAMHKAEKIGRFSDLTLLVDSLLALNRLRTPMKIRQSHLKKQKRQDQQLDNLEAKIGGVEDYVVDQIKPLIKGHPAYPWFSQIRGVGPENISKVVGLIDAFGRDYDTCDNGHRWAPPAKMKGQKKKKSVCPTCGGSPTGKKVFVPGIERLGSISALNRYAGWGHGEDGQIDKRVAGKLSHFNMELKTMSWRLGAGLNKAGLRICPHCSMPVRPRFVCLECEAEYESTADLKRCTVEGCDGKLEKRRDRQICDQCGKNIYRDDNGNQLIPKCVGSYAQAYERFRAQEVRKALDAGIKIIEAPGRMCNACGWKGDNPKQEKCPKCDNKTVARLPRKCEQCGLVTEPKDTKLCPACNTKLPKMVEEPGTIWMTHIVKRAHRKMVKLFLSHLWLKWREAASLPVVSPYPIAVQGHKDFISPDEMIDKPAKAKGKRGRKKKVEE